MANYANIKRAFVKACMDEGITDEVDMSMAGVQVIRGIKGMTIAGYKAAATRMRIRRKFRR